jgi:hypothetical protein
MWLLFFRNKAYSPCAVENTAFCHCSGPVGSDRRSRHQRSHAPLWCKQKQYLSLARATQWRKKTLLLFALTHQFLQQIIEGDELYTRVNKKVAPDASQGWTIVLMDRATRFIWDMHCGRKDRKLFKNAMRLLCHVIEQTGDLTLLTDGERRYGSLLFELCSEVLRTGKRGRPKKTLRKGVKVRLKNKGSQRHKRGPKRPKYQAPYPEHPDTAQPLATTEIHANHLEAFHTSLRRRCAAYRRRTNMYAKNTGRLQERLDVYWIVHNFVRVHFTTHQVPAVALGVLECGLSLNEILCIQKIA